MFYHFVGFSAFKIKKKIILAGVAWCPILHFLSDTGIYKCKGRKTNKKEICLPPP